ncbi:tyrosine--tRNA ligase [Azospirillum doebereinerae]|uniref:Tyrosine--tRNA ligase n=1 Tax=Azospirillum doebereinerae TaxID=92933 RepID=A0A3S1CJ13_9PROT|nr:tyrosine--tRNA ligase [Azospirillum doebereinerae]MCG5239969.1 tyrosine--tRNA ligase [Azospirillum doebereinerae]RUQ75029.1 tyrosine--tRNA ligase [Azospirillum doebereinerae]
MTTTPSSDFLRTLQERGFIHQCTDLAALDERAQKGPIVAYIGFDCTADSLHVGSLLPIMMLRWLQKTGHKPIVLMGGGTTRIGDPSGKDEARQLLTDEVIASNMEGIKRIFGRYLTFGDGPTDAVMVNNGDWLDELKYIPLLRDIGRHFTINRMLSFESVKLRLDREQPLTFLEFNYMILQAYDFVELKRRLGCSLQMGGSDQWGNIINGVELGRRTDGAELFGLTTPLLTTSSGAKMGKTAAGAVWLTADKLSSYDFWQYWRNTEDADVGRFLRLYTELPLDEIARLEALEGAGINEAKKILANAVTSLAHGEEAALEAAETARRAFEEGAAADGLPTIDVARADLEAGVPVVDLLVSGGLAASKGEARRLIKGGGAKLNDATIADETAKATAADLNADGVVKLSAGKKRHALVKAV